MLRYPCVQFQYSMCNDVAGLIQLASEKILLVQDVVLQCLTNCRLWSKAIGREQACLCSQWPKSKSPTGASGHNQWSRIVLWCVSPMTPAYLCCHMQCALAYCLDMFQSLRFVLLADGRFCRIAHVCVATLHQCGQFSLESSFLSFPCLLTNHVCVVECPCFLSFLWCGLLPFREVGVSMSIL